MRENQTPRNLNEEEGAIGVIEKLLDESVRVYGDEDDEIDELESGSLLVMSSAFKKFIFVLFIA